MGVVSPLDLFSTLRDLAGSDLQWEADLQSRGIKVVEVAPAKPYQERLIVDLVANPEVAPRSLFRHLPKNRTCAQAAVPSGHCSLHEGVQQGPWVSVYCMPYEDLSDATRRQLSASQANDARRPFKDDEDRQVLCDFTRDVIGPKIVGEL